MPSNLTFQDLLDDFSAEVFVGRGEQLTLFEQALEASRPPFLILNISGQGGVGKSTLLERYEQLVASHKVASALVNEDYVVIPKVLASFATQLNAYELNFDTFNGRYHKYLELKEQVESDPKMPSGLFDFALRRATKIGLRSLKRIPVAGEVTDVFLTPDAEDTIADQTSAFAKYIFQKFSHKDERILLLETDAELTRHFLNDLNKSVDRHKTILFFDTFEKTAPSIENWLIDLLSGEFGKFSGNTLFVIAGRFPLGQEWTRFRKAIRQIELHEFTENEARDYLVRSGISDENLINQLIKISGRLPVLLALLVSSPSQLPHDVSGDAVERFLQGATLEHREAALAASLPRYFNQDILKIVLGSEGGQAAFEWLSEAHFVRTSERGWVYHDVVRSMMLKYFQLRSQDQYLEKQKLLEDYYKKRESNLGLAEQKQQQNELWRKFELERIYHHICQNPSRHIEYTAKLFSHELLSLIIDTQNNQSSTEMDPEGFKAIIEGCASILEQIADESDDLTIGMWADKFQLLVSSLQDDNDNNVDSEKMKELFLWFSHCEGLDDKELSILYLLAGLVGSASEEGDIELALADIDKSIQLFPDFAFYYLTSGQVKMEAKRYPAALGDFSKAIELQPENGQNYYWRGRTHLEAKDYPTALADFTKAIELQPENSNNYRWRGRTHLEAKDYPAALTDFTKAIELQPENSYNYHWRGRTHLGATDYPAALADFTRTIELQPENSYNYRWRGRTHLEAKDYPAALADFTKAIELQPEDGDHYYWRAHTQLEAKDYPAALADFTKTIELQPEDGYNYHWRGRTHLGATDYPAALADFTKATELQPEDSYSYHWRGRTHLEAKDYPTALADFTKAIELQPEDGDHYYWRAHTQLEAKDYPAALADFTKTIELQPENSYKYHWRGRTHLEAKDYPAALADFTKAIELQPEDGDHYYWRAHTQLEAKDYPAALADFTKAIELQPENSYKYHWRGRTYYEMKDYPEALSDFSKAIQLDPNRDWWLYQRALTYFVLEMNDEYAADLESAIGLIKSGPEEKLREWYVVLNLAAYFLTGWQTENARILYQQAAKECTDQEALEDALEDLEQLIELEINVDEVQSIHNLLTNALEGLRNNSINNKER